MWKIFLHLEPAGWTEMKTGSAANGKNPGRTVATHAGRYHAGQMHRPMGAQSNKSATGPMCVDLSEKYLRRPLIFEFEMFT